MVMVIPIVLGALGTIPKRLVKGLEDLEIREQSGDHSDYNIIKIGQNTQKSPGDLRRLAVSSERPSASTDGKITQKE